MAKQLLKGEKLLQRAKELGIDSEDEKLITGGEYELQRRIMEAERSRRESML